ncbi:MAG: putative siderophore transport system ATP-binding protein YusV [Luteibacter sp.]|uniref:ABC transporter ATP-binding protein n=1 Tax=Luteibacter sp. TaxID=1886636 RepID=UPI0013815558|nr:ABC transporter ATP-binding protein [Luteibacter sp.]KAF1006262.1 MAG: putative siderophore transport system ATP-binding protein YusV [Luteibacter sp.]
MTTTLATESLRLDVDGRVLVDVLDLRIVDGEVWAVIGPNGAGKSTLLRTLAGLRAPDGGAVQLDGRDLATYRPRELARRRGFLPQSVVDAFSLTVWDAVAAARHPHLPFWHWGDDGDDTTRRALALFELEALADRDVTTLSGGERQRVNIAALFAQDVAFLLLDEPLSSLDLHQQMKVLHALERTAVREERAIVYSVHDINLAARHATHAILLDGQGHAIAGDIATVITSDHLSAAFHHPIHGVDIDGERFFRAGRLTDTTP